MFFRSPRFKPVIPERASLSHPRPLHVHRGRAVRALEGPSFPSVTRTTCSGRCAVPTNRSVDSTPAIRMVSSWHAPATERAAQPVPFSGQAPLVRRSPSSPRPAAPCESPCRSGRVGGLGDGPDHDHPARPRGEHLVQPGQADPRRVANHGRVGADFAACLSRPRPVAGRPGLVGVVPGRPSAEVVDTRSRRRPRRTGPGRGCCGRWAEAERRRRSAGPPGPAGRSSPRCSTSAPAASATSARSFTASRRPCRRHTFGEHLEQPEFLPRPSGPSPATARHSPKHPGRRRGTAADPIETAGNRCRGRVTRPKASRARRSLVIAPSNHGSGGCLSVI